MIKDLVIKKLKEKIAVPAIITNTLMENINFTLTFDKVTPQFQKLINEAAVKELSNSLFWQNMLRNDKPVFILGEGKHLLKFKDFMAILEITEQGETKTENGYHDHWISQKKFKGVLHTSIWNRQKLLDLVDSCLGEFTDHPTISIINSRRHFSFEMDLTYADQEQFINQDVYNSIDQVFDRMKNHPEWYKENKVKFRETILLFGPPGTGKSTLARHFAAKYGISLTSTKPNCCNQFSHHKGDNLNIILFEDIDAEPKLLKSYMESAGSSLSLDEFDYSDFINWLDGVVPLDNTIIIMTTNYCEKIKKAVIRNGRVTRRILVPYLKQEELIGYIGEKFRNVINTFEEGRITINMIPELREAKDDAEFIELVNSLSSNVKDESDFENR